MTHYEMFLMGGSALLALSVLMFFTAASQDMPLQKSIAIFALAAGLLLLADKSSHGGLNPADIPHVFNKFILSFF